MKRTAFFIFGLVAAFSVISALGRELRIGILPDADSLPLMAAEARNLFADESVNVRLVRFQNPVERDAAFQSGAVDGVIGDILAATLAVQGGFDVRITSLTDGRYGIVAAPESGITSLRDLAGKPVGLSSNTIIQYMVDSFLIEAGVPEAKIIGLAVPKMPVRLEMVLAGQTAGAGLPEPLLTMAQLRGARLLASTDDSGLRAGILMFSRKSLDEKTDEIRGMYRAYWKAAQAINADNDSWRPFLAEKAGFPAQAISSFRFIRYEKPRLPTVADIARVLSWMKTKGLLTAPVAPESLLDGRALAGW